MSEHTKEPWSWDAEFPSNADSMTFDDWREWECENAPWIEDINRNRVLGGSIHCNQANARRIVACVNACAGVDNETLEKIASGDMDGSEIFELAKVKQQCDALLSALKEVIGADSEGHMIPSWLVESAKAAIKLTEGE